MKRLTALLLLACLTLPALAAGTGAPAKRPIAHEDVWLMQRPGTPVPSPDGRWIVFPLPEPNYDHEKRSADLWIVPADGSAPPRRLTSTRDSEGSVTWSPDSKRLAFTAKREGDTERQVYVLDLAAGGEAQRVTDLAAGAIHPRWSPDGQALLVSTLAYPGATGEESNRKAIEERKARKFNTRAYEEFPIRHWDRWLDERRPMLVVQPLDGSAPRYLLGGTTLFEERGFGGVLGQEGESLQATWTPDGSGVVFVATDHRHEGARAEVTEALWHLPLAGGEPRRLTDGKASWSNPEFSADGRYLYAKVTPVTRQVYNLTRLARWPWGSDSRPEVLTVGMHRSVSDFALAQDGSRAFFTAEHEGLRRIYSVAPGEAVSELGSPEAGSFSALRVGGGDVPVVTALWESAVNPPEVVRIDAATGRREALSAFNVERAAAIDWLPVEHFWFTSSRGRRIHSVLVKPPGFDPSKKYPLFVLIHGGPHTMLGDEFVTRWNYHLLAQPGYVVLVPNYSGSTGFGEPFAQAIQRDPLQGPASELNEAADAAIRAFPFIDASRQAAGGASYGGHLANWLAVSTTRYRALVSHAGLFDLRSQWTTSDVVYHRERNMGGPEWERPAAWRDQSPFYRTPQLRTPILLTYGERDFRVPINNGLEFWSMLKRQDVPSRLVVFPDENHWILKGENSREFYREVHAWLARYLEPQGAAQP
jgi:dipeptidyl aminopeptidase/acylaminoacyl peptidase